MKAEEMEARMKTLESQVNALQTLLDIEEIKKLQRAYGYYLEHWMAREIVNLGFANDAISAASSQGIPGLRIVPTSVPCESSVKEDVEAGIDEAVDAIVATLTKPLTTAEKSPRKAVTPPARIPFKGSLEEVNRFYYRRGWADGLPIIPPTEEAVAEMLTGTDLPPDHIVGELVPRMGKATVEKIAINAVMAGALPTYMPILIAGVEILADPTSGSGTWGVSTGSWRRSGLSTVPYVMTCA